MHKQVRSDLCRWLARTIAIVLLEFSFWFVHNDDCMNHEQNVMALHVTNEIRSKSKDGKNSGLWKYDENEAKLYEFN